jgi:hypothetical protein
MIRIILAALRANPAQTLTIALLAAVAAGLSAILPAYLVGAVESGTVATVEAAPVGQRVITTALVIPAGSAEADAARRLAEVRRAIERPGLRLIGGMRASVQFTVPPTGQLTAPGGTGQPQFPAVVAARDDFCRHLRITGTCPAGDHDALVSAREAERLGLRPGAELRYAAATLTVTGTYQVTDPAEPYWTDGSVVRVNPVFVRPGAFRVLAPSQVFVTADGLVTAALFTDLAPTTTTTALTEDVYGLQREGYTVSAAVLELGNRITTNRRLLLAGVPVAGLQVLVLCWLTLGLALRHGSAGWRADVGLLKLRGARRGRILVLAVGRSAVPILAGAGAGVAVALVTGHFRSGEAPLRLAVPSAVLALSAAGAAALAVLGSLVVAAAAERRVLREPVLDLMRRVSERRRAWRAGAVEVVIVVLAVAAVYQVRSAPRDVAAAAAGLALFVPVLVAPAMALTGTRLLGPVAAAAARRAFGGGRVSTGLAVIDLARRPGARRLTALLVVAVALLVTAGAAWSSAATARDRRATLELGADRVVSVTARNSTHLLAAVRSADPSGRAAMAVVAGRLGTESDAPAVVAVDATRLAAVGAWDTRAARAALARRLRPDVAPAVVVTGTAVELELSMPDGDAVPVPGAGDATVELALVDRRGIGTTVRLGPLAPGRQRVRVATPACAAAACRLVSITVLPVRSTAGQPAPDNGEAPSTAPIVLHRLDQVDPPATLLDPAGFGDVRRWRQPMSAQRPSLVFSQGSDGLNLRVSTLGPPESTSPDTGSGQPAVPAGSPAKAEPLTVEVADAPLPVPLAATGPGVDDRPGGLTYPLLGSTRAPVRIAANTGPLPRVGAAGMLMDLEYADRLVRGLDGAYEVWLSRDASAALLERLRGEGLLILHTDSIDAVTGRYAAHAGTAVLRMYLVVAVAGLLLAAGSVVLVGVVDRPARAAELAALRVQGVSGAALRRSVRTGYAAAVVVSVVLGVLAALVVRALADAGLPLFDDGWAVLAAPGPSWSAVGLLAAGLLVALGPAVLAASSRPAGHSGGPR